MSYYSNFRRKASDGNEILREDRGVMYKSYLVIVEGMLTLTEKNLLFVTERVTDSSEVDHDPMELGNDYSGTDASAEVLTDNGYDLSIPLNDIVSIAVGESLVNPSLKVAWHYDNPDEIIRVEFVQNAKPANRSEETINLWVREIEDQRLIRISETQNERSPFNSFYMNNLERRILDLLGDGQWKGLAQMTRQLEEGPGESLDIDQVESVCKNLVAQELVEQEEGSDFFRKRPDSGL
jgi:hypothetical protein